jgi:peptidoglycan/xylan/chitin deacetylase (PgdA/CDA1 family)
MNIIPTNVRAYLTPSYCWATMPVRATARWALNKRNCAPVMLLFYHRVADEQPNPWTITNDGFLAQIDWFSENFDFVSLEEAQRRLRHGSNRPSLHITFDDGYAENCHKALPLLIKREIPFTYFVTIGNVLEQRPFPHDVALGQSLKPNTVDEIQALANAGVEIGNHTWNHADLGNIRTNALEKEVTQPGKELAQITGKRMRYFSFPFGRVENLSRKVSRRLLDEGYEGVCSAYGGYNFPGKAMAELDAFHLQRFHGDPSLARMKNWLTLDPRWSIKRRKWDPPVGWFTNRQSTKSVKEKFTDSEAMSPAGTAEESL